ncbi:MAG: hypothetical protein KC616_23980, partial [Myxococcales bacterium]|nr:hypothetical protein [Myxococcales bacterium]
MAAGAGGIMNGERLRPGTGWVWLVMAGLVSVVAAGWATAADVDPAAASVPGCETRAPESGRSLRALVRRLRDARDPGRAGLADRLRC